VFWCESKKLSDYNTAAVCCMWYRYGTTEEADFDELMKLY
jgi:hypothetical protein